MTPCRPLARRILPLLADRRAATAVEYGLICAVIVLVMLASLKGVATATIGIWGNVSARVQAAH